MRLHPPITRSCKWKLRVLMDQLRYLEPDLLAVPRGVRPSHLEVTWHQHSKTGEHHPCQHHQDTCCKGYQTVSLNPSDQPLCCLSNFSDVFIANMWDKIHLKQILTIRRDGDNILCIRLQMTAIPMELLVKLPDETRSWKFKMPALNFKYGHLNLYNR